MTPSEEKICCIFKGTPHYRESVYLLMGKEMDCDFYFGVGRHSNIPKLEYGLFKKSPVELTSFPLFLRFYWMRGAVDQCFKGYRSYLLTGEPYCLSTWIILLLNRFLGKRTFLWSHGWYGNENYGKRMVKRAFFLLAHSIFVYGDYAKKLMILNGISEKKIHVIYNSLDHDRQLLIRSKLKKSDLYVAHFNNKLPVVIFLGRLEKNKKINLLLDAQRIGIDQKSCPFNLVLVGEGPEKHKLEALVDNYNTAPFVWFYGACYDEFRTSELIHNADLCVSPGNVGLTAIHSLTYGTPVITHNNFSHQMPEFEAIVISGGGMFFEENDPYSLSASIQKWLMGHPLKSSDFIDKCHKVIDEKYNPRRQVEIMKQEIERAQYSRCSGKQVNKHKVCLVIPSLHLGGMERVMCELAGYICQRPGAEVHLVMYGRKPEIFYSIPENLTVHQSDQKFDNSKRLWSAIRRMVFLRRTVKRIDPMAILSFGEYWNSFVLIALWGLRCPVFVSDRCRPDKSLSRAQKGLRKILYPAAEGVIVQTLKAQSIYRRMIPRAKIFLIGNPIRSVLSGLVEKKENIVLTVGRLIPSKHHDELIRMFARIAAPDWKLVIVGGKALDQDITGRLQDLIRELKVEDSVVLTGNRPDVDSYYQKSRIFAFTSSSEGFPNAIGEAMSAGLPVIAFDCMAGPSEMIQDDVDGILVPLFDYKGYEAKLKRLMEDEALRDRLGKKAQKSIQRFSVSEIGEKYYSALVGQ